MDGAIPVPSGRLPRIAALSVTEFAAARSLVASIDRAYPGEKILGVSIDAVAALAATPAERALVARLRRLRPADIGVSTPSTLPPGQAHQRDVTVGADVSVDDMLAGRIPAAAATSRVVRLTGQMYWSARQGTFAPARPALVATVALEPMASMVRAMSADIGRRPLIVSQHRTRGHQLAVILRDVVDAGGDLATVFNAVALPGYSEHQDLDRPAFDLASIDGRLGDDFRSTEEYAWLMRNAHRFGFALSYPDGNQTGIKPEPWHWRYTGPPPGGS